MNASPVSRIVAFTAAGLLLTAGGTLSAQSSMATPTTAVLTRLTVKPDVDRPRLMKVMPEEASTTMASPIRMKAIGLVFMYFFIISFCYVR